MKQLPAILALLLSLLFMRGHGQAIPVNYNLVWNTPSENAGASMPCGGGDIGLNVWVEKGDLLLYVARSGQFDENNALFKTGRIRIRLAPSVFSSGKFKQELHVKEGYVEVEGEQKGIKVNVRIRVDVFRPFINIDIRSSAKTSAVVTYENWRYRDRIIERRENFGNSWKWAAPKSNSYRKDEIAFNGNEILFYHQNTDSTIFDATVAQQGMDKVKDQLFNPLKHLTFGGMLRATGFIPAGVIEGNYAGTDFKGWQLKSKPASSHSIQMILERVKSPDIQVFKNRLLSVAASNDKEALDQTTQWWKEFWERSFIHVSDHTDSLAAQVTRNYALFRYMLACNAFSNWPTKFNGGLFTVDPVFTDEKQVLTPDYRNWGGGLHTAQNQRLVYFPMIKNGDWDLLQPQLEFYMRLLKNAELRSRVYWNHAGACFTEQMENYGLPDYAEYGQKRPADFDKGVEYNAWLEYQWDTVLEFCLMMLDEIEYRDAFNAATTNERIVFIESCLRFFDEHYQYLAKQRGIKPLDGNGKLVLYPGSAAETFKMAYNPSSTIAGLRVVATRLLDIQQKIFFMLPYPGGHTVQDSSVVKRIAYIGGLIERIPGIPFTNVYGHTTIAPAIKWERINNIESPQLYPVFPWGIYGLGKPGFDTAVNTWKYDTNVIRFRNHIGWKQDNIWAARLGLADEAWRLTSAKLKNSGRRFSAFWGPGYDWVPDHNQGGSGMIGLQEMLLQTDGKRILILPAWPKEKNVHFKLHAPFNTTVEVEWIDGQMKKMIILPKEREADVEVMK